MDELTCRAVWWGMRDGGELRKLGRNLGTLAAYDRGEDGAGDRRTDESHIDPAFVCMTCATWREKDVCEWWRTDRKTGA